jgi:hypothetical protein
MNLFSQLASKVRFLIYLVQTGQFGTVVGTVRHKAWSTTIAYGLHRDLTVPWTAPEAAIPLSIRKATKVDIDLLTDLNETGVPKEALAERRARLMAFNGGMNEHCWVAVDEHDIPCYMQIVMYPEQNELKRKVWGKSYPNIKTGQVLLEAALVPFAFRGKRIHARAKSLIAANARTDVATEAITFVDETNVASLKGVARAGFVPYCRRINRWRIFRESSTFVPLPENTIIPGFTGSTKEIH